VSFLILRSKIKKDTHFLKSIRMQRDQYYLLKAMEVAQRGVSQGAGGPFGCVVVDKSGDIIGEGHNEVLARKDPTCHAEVVAIRHACAHIGDFQLEGCTVYATCEPCPMCLGALYWARPSRIVFSCTREEAAAIGFDDAFIYRELVLPAEVRAIPTEHSPLGDISSFMKNWGDNEQKSLY
jgi:tRNA(Arg) A34 adenosine deaminase TadA